MSRLRFPIIAAMAVVAASAAGWGIGRWRNESPSTPSVADAAVINGALLYQFHCASCHGAEGQGDGPSAVAGQSPPRDFWQRPWRFEPTRESIRQVTLDGIPGTGMPSFRLALSAAEVDAVASHVHRLANTGPRVEQPLTEGQRLLHRAHFTDLRGAAPPPLTLRDTAGKTVKLADFKGRLVLLHFWGTECVHCLEEIPALAALEARWAPRLKVIHVCADEDDAVAAQAVLARLVPGKQGYVEARGLGLARFEVQSLPTVWLIDPTGRAIGRATGTRDWRAAPQKELIDWYLPTSGEIP